LSRQDQYRRQGGKELSFSRTKGNVYRGAALLQRRQLRGFYRAISLAQGILLREWMQALRVWVQAALIEKEYPQGNSCCGYSERGISLFILKFISKQVSRYTLPI
jgi:hypothetical protein